MLLIQSILLSAVAKFNTYRMTKDVWVAKIYYVQFNLKYFLVSSLHVL